MFQISVVIKMSGLLLLTPSNSDYHLPYYALLPQEKDHEAFFAFRRTGSCPQGTIPDSELCYFRIEGEEITIGPAVPPAPKRFNGSLGDVSKAAGVPVPASLLGKHPSTRVLQSRIRLNAGEQTNQCHLARWFFNGNPWAPLGNVITWEFAPEPGDLMVTRRRLANLEGPPATVVVRRPASGNFELFVLHTPPTDPPRPGFLHEARHFDHYYEMLGVAQAGRRPLPVLLRGEAPSCPWPVGGGPVTRPRAPGAPTCLVAGGVPAPPGR